MPDQDDEELERTITDAAEKCGFEVLTGRELEAFLAESKAKIAAHEAEMEAKGRTRITEEMDVHKGWYPQAKAIQGPSELNHFVSHLINDYIHDYGTICHACAAAAIAAISAVDHSEVGGITGFQASAIMWEFISKWMHKEGPLRLVEYEDMLYPFNESKFTTISKDTFAHLVGKAKQKMDERPDAHPDVYAHWKSISEGMVPFGFIVEEK